MGLVLALKLRTLGIPELQVAIIHLCNGLSSYFFKPQFASGLDMLKLSPVSPLSMDYHSVWSSNQ